MSSTLAVRLARHTDSAEEIVLVLAGAAVVDVAGREADVKAGGVVVIPEEVPHEVRNSGPRIVRAVGFFATASPVSMFDEPVMPGGTRVRGTTR